MGLVLIAPPAEEPISLTEAKLHLRVDIGSDDLLIDSLITAARMSFETDTRRALITQTWELVLDAFPTESELELPRPPLQSVTSITYKDAAGVTETFPASEYVVDSSGLLGRVVLRGGSWPAVPLWPAGAVKVRFVAGYGVATAVPQAIKQALLLLIGHWYENREAVTIQPGAVGQTLPMGYERLMWQFRVVDV